MNHEVFAKQFSWTCNVQMLAELFCWTDEFAKAFLLELRYCGSFYHAYNQAFGINVNQKSNGNPFKEIS